MSGTEQSLDATFAGQPLLPALPVPPLEGTVRRFLEWTAPLLSEEQQEETRKAGEDFLSPSGGGVLLQQALEEYAAQPEVANWLEQFWVDSYLLNRFPVPIHSNIFYLLEKEADLGENPQARRALELVVLATRCYQEIQKETLPPDTERGNPLCMAQYRNMFRGCRIPRLGGDLFRASREDAGKSEHAAVIHKGRFYALEVLDPRGEIHSPREILRALEEILGDPRPPRKDSCSLGILTTWDRDSWARAREMLVTHHEDNAALLRMVEESLFVLALDHEEPESLDTLAAAMLHGDGRSRWFDKTLQLIVTPRGESAINMEHSRTDGSVISTFAAFLRKHGEELGSLEGAEGAVAPREMEPVFSPSLEQELLRCADAYDELCNRTRVTTLLFRGFGKEEIKSLKVSPDGFVQMALQLARYRTYGVFCTSYEPVMTRRFLHGRTEAIRQVSRESIRFVQLMEDKKASSRDRALALREAVEEHVRRARTCKDGHGVDRHLYGLLNLYRRKGFALGVEGLPGIFLSPGWQVLIRNVLSTSTSAPRGLALAGFGPVVEEGFGVRYLVHPRSIHINLASRIQQEEALHRFKENLSQSLEEMRKLLQEHGGV